MPNQRQLKSYPDKFHWTIVTIHKEQIARRRCPFKINDKKKNLCAIQSGIPESVFCENSEYVNPEMMRCFLRRQRPLPCSESVTVETEPVNASRVPERDPQPIPPSFLVSVFIQAVLHACMQQ